MDVGTAKPSSQELAQFPHRLIDIREPDQPYSAAEFVADARREMAEISARGRIPLLVGGTMFYFHSLEFGLSGLPAANPQIRQRLEQEAQQAGWDTLHARLAGIDPESGIRIHANDAQRIQRALEIIELTGQTPSAIGQELFEHTLPYSLIRIALWPDDREALRARIGDRFGQMLEMGLVEEVEGLLKRTDFDPRLPSMRMVGYRQVIEHLQGLTGFDDMKVKAVNATRQLAKRQLTWIRGYPGLETLECMETGLTGRGLRHIGSKMSEMGLY
jgi:tRNA dimethylallyltransferase